MQPTNGWKDMLTPVRCTFCGDVYDLAAVHVTVRHADCSVYKAPCCGHDADDREGVSLPSFRRVTEHEIRYGFMMDEYS